MNKYADKLTLSELRTEQANMWNVSPDYSSAHDSKLREEERKEAYRHTNRYHRERERETNRQTDTENTHTHTASQNPD
jgi:hypothetical protein